MTNLLILSSHAVLEYDDLRLFTRLGYDVFMPGGYADPRTGNEVRPGVPEAPYHPDLAALVHEQRERHAGEPDGYPVIDWGKADLHPGLIEWADIIMVNCFPEAWIGGQWARIRDKRVIWRTIGQSDPGKELLMRPFAERGLQIVRYSPAEKRAFEPLGVFAGEDAMIRFAKDPQDYGPWTGDWTVSQNELGSVLSGPGRLGWESLKLKDGRPYVGHLSQHDKVPGQRDAFINWAFVLEATAGLPFVAAGANSETVGGLGTLPYDVLRDFLAGTRVLLYTGTQPASYTLGLMEAMLTGTPVVSIGPERMWLPALFEGHQLAPWQIDTAAHAREALPAFLSKPIEQARAESVHIRADAIKLFGYDAVGRQWTEFLGAPVREMVAA